MALTLAASLLGALDAVAWVERHGFTPDTWQAEALRSEHPRELWNVTRQGGKSTTAAFKTGHEAVHGPDGYTAILTGPSERQALELQRKTAAVIRQAVHPSEIVAEGATHLELTRNRRVLAVPAKEKTVRGFSAVHRLVLDEAARVPDDLYRAVRPMLAVSGGSLLALSTPYGRRGWFYAEWSHGTEQWRRREVPWTACPRITPAFIAEERESARRQGLDPDAWIGQEYECSFAAAVQGAYYGRLLEQAQAAGRIGAYPYDPLRGPVSTAWDLGVANPAVWFYQVHGPAVYVVAYREPSGAGLDGYAGLLQQMPYGGNYREHAWPHDGARRSEESGRLLRDAGEAVGITPIRVLERTADLDTDIRAVKSLLPRCYFDARECAAGLEALAFYHTEFDEVRRTFQPKPAHDWSCHAADAFRTLAVAIGSLPTRATRLPTHAEMTFNPLTYDQPRPVEDRYGRPMRPVAETEWNPWD